MVAELGVGAGGGVEALHVSFSRSYFPTVLDKDMFKLLIINNSHYIHRLMIYMCYILRFSHESADLLIICQMSEVQYGSRIPTPWSQMLMSACTANKFAKINFKAHHLSSILKFSGVHLGIFFSLLVDIVLTI